MSEELPSRCGEPLGVGAASRGRIEWGHGVEGVGGRGWDRGHSFLLVGYATLIQEAM